MSTTTHPGIGKDGTGTKTIYLIDGSGYIYRAYHAIRGLSNSKGLPTNAVFGFTRMLMKLIEVQSPQWIVMFFDAKGPTFRHEIYTDYKANRPPMPEDLVVQLPYIKEVTRGFNIQAVELSGYEADDLIGTAARAAVQQGYRAVVVSADKDMKQLISDDVIMLDPMKDTVFDLNAITETGITPAQLIDVMGLSGDASDNIPGVPGIGPKGATALIQTFGSMEQLYEQVDTITKKKQHENLVRFREQAFLSKTLVTIDTDAPLAFRLTDFKLKAPDTSILSKLFAELEFRQLQNLFPRETDLSNKTYLPVITTDELDDLIGVLTSAPLISMDTETTSVNPMLADLVGFSFAVKPDEGFYIPCCHRYLGAPEQLDRRMVIDRLKPVFENPAIKKIGQNIKYDWIVLDRHGICLEGVAFDTMLASYLINPSKRAHNLDQIALDFLDHKTITYADIAGKGKKSVSFAEIPVAKATPYACEDADITLMAYRVLKPKVEKLGLAQLLEDIEMPLVPVLKRMEMRGIRVDRDKLDKLSRSFEQQLKQIEEKIYALAGERFNIKSSQQLGAILFEKLQLPVQKKTKKRTGYSTDVEVLTILADKHELPERILRHRTLAKLKSTYADALLDLIHPDTQRIHTSYNQTVTATGRLSSSGPNLQNIPIRTEEGKEIRKCFVPKEGWHLLSADYSQIELRILAHCSNDEILIEAFKEDEDIHTRTASEVFQVFPSFITADLRRQAKIINFGIIYGMSPFGLSKSLKISQKMAKTYIENYFGRYRGVKAFIEKITREARKTEKTTTLSGRIRLIPEINSNNGNLRKFAERIAINTPIQGSAADLIKIAMIEVDQALDKGGHRSAMLLSVHDEIILEVPPDELDAVTALVKNIMESVWNLSVPLKVNLDSGANWAAAH
ncbi:MAG: DNA polymerase I [Deltaproteobacteria bacterium]|nr:DNA polymerase I [Deltaproteobacteria bacterium]